LKEIGRKDGMKNLLPKVIISKEEFAIYISMIFEQYKDCGIPSEDLSEMKKSFFDSILNEELSSHYFVGVILLKKVSFFTILHEFIHHIATLLRYYTLSPLWFELDYINELIAHLKSSLSRS